MGAESDPIAAVLERNPVKQRVLDLLYIRGAHEREVFIGDTDFTEEQKKRQLGSDEPPFVLDAVHNHGLKEADVYGALYWLLDVGVLHRTKHPLMPGTGTWSARYLDEKYASKGVRAVQ